MCAVRGRWEEEEEDDAHLRVGCIVFAWDNQSSGPFWSALKMQPVLSDPVPCFKALVTVHKLLVNGPPVVLAEAVQEIGFLEQCARIHGSQNGAFASSYGYGPLISSYVSFLLTKIEFHRTHPEFTGNFDYEEYLSIKGVQDLDEGYRTIDEMMELQERLDLFQRSVFENFGGAAAGGGVECRVSAFVPLVDESYGMYKFVTSMLSAMHLSKGGLGGVGWRLTHDVLVLLLSCLVVCRCRVARSVDFAGGALQQDFLVVARVLRGMQQNSLSDESCGDSAAAVVPAAV